MPKKKQPRPVAPVAVDPNAPVFEIGDRVEVLRPNLWSGYFGEVEKVAGGLCYVLLWKTEKSQLNVFHADIPADALAVLEKCLSSDKLTMPIELDRKRHKAGRFRLESGLISNSILSIEDTLPLAIARFAKALYSK